MPDIESMIKAQRLLCFKKIILRYQPSWVEMFLQALITSKRWEVNFYSIATLISQSYQ